MKFNAFSNIYFFLIKLFSLQTVHGSKTLKKKKKKTQPPNVLTVILVLGNELFVSLPLFLHHSPSRYSYYMSLPLV